MPKGGRRQDPKPSLKPKPAARDATATKPRSSPQDAVRKTVSRTFKPSKLLTQAAMMLAREDSTKRAEATREMLSPKRGKR